MTEFDCITASLNISSPIGKAAEKIETDNGCTRSMVSEESRFTSFVDWPLLYLGAEQLAPAGFYYTKKGDIVKCAFCGIELGQWNRDDDVRQDHQKWSPCCPFVRGRSCGNVPMSRNPAADRTGPSDGHDTCGKFGIQLRPNSYSENEEPRNGLSKYAIQAKPPQYPAFTPLEKRLLSYEEWPVSLKQKPKDLAEAGFYYTGKGDQTICFSCGGGLKNWEEDDVPWEQHARWFPKCSFLLLQKSKEYVKEVCSKHEAVLTSEQAESLSSVPNTPSTSTVKGGGEPPVGTNDGDTKPTVEDETTKENPVASKSTTLCKICYTNEVGVVFLPCGHMVACINCAPALTKCAVCRGDLEATVRAFLS